MYLLRSIVHVMGDHLRIGTPVFSSMVLIIDTSLVFISWCRFRVGTGIGTGTGVGDETAFL